MILEPCDHRWTSSAHRDAFNVCPGQVKGSEACYIELESSMMSGSHEVSVRTLSVS